MAAIDNAARLDRDWLSSGMSDLGSIRSRTMRQRTEERALYLATDRPSVVTTSLWLFASILAALRGSRSLVPGFNSRSGTPYYAYGTMESIDHTATTDVQG
jgi:hypothetical protein